MQQATYTYIAEMEDAHWWYRARNRIIGLFTRRHISHTGLTTAVVGCGTGATVRIWHDISRELIGVDNSEDALRLAAGKGFTKLIRDDAATLALLPSAHFDVVAALDVLEHIEDDRAAIAALHRVLKPEGTLIITVPAKQYLWGGADILSLHKRRYNAPDLFQKLRAAKFSILDHTYFNTLLLPPIYFMRCLERWLHLKPDLEYRIPNPFLNALLYGIFVIELGLLRYVRLPVGVSLLIVARKTEN